MKSVTIKVVRTVVVYFIVLLTSLVPLFLFENPILALLFSQLIICLYFVFSLQTRLSLLILFFPIVCFVISQGYDQSFLSLGDGSSYVPLAYDFQEKYLGEVPSMKHDNGIQTFLFYFHHIGAYPTVIGTEAFFGSNVPHIVYYLFQEYLFLVLISILFVLCLCWKIFSKSVLEIIFLFILISPTFFELGSAVTRHYFTFFNVFLFFISLTGLVKRTTTLRFIFLGISVFFTFLGKPAYLIPMAVTVFFILKTNFKTSRKFLVYFVFLFVAISTYSLSWNLIQKYDKFLFMTGNTVNVSGMFAFPIKLIMAIFAPFPWYDFEIHSGIYGGNFLLFIFHIFSSLFGLWILLNLIFYYKSISEIDVEQKNLILFGLIMSSTIFFGASGFHGYLSIFFPFFSPFLIKKKYSVSISIVIFLSLALNIILALYK